jgi:hypothetical protein
VIAHEARCTKCNEIFNPEDEDDLIHGADECDGIGQYLGAWNDSNG